MRLFLAFALACMATSAQADPHWHGGPGQWHGDNNGWHGGGGFLSGVIGGAIGSAIVNGLEQPAPSAPVPLQPFTPPWYTYCGQKYASFNAQTGYFTGFDGKPYFCQ